MDASDDNLFRTTTSGLDIENDIRNGTATPFTARDSSDTERAMIIATILHFDKGTCTAVQARQRLPQNGFEIK